MVTQKQTHDLLIGPKGALWLVGLTLIIGLIAWAMAHGPQRTQTTYNQTNQPGLYDAGSYNGAVPGGPSLDQGALQSAPPAGPSVATPQTK